MNNTNNTANIKKIKTDATSEEIIKAKYLKWNRLWIKTAKVLTVIMIITALLLSKYVFKPDGRSVSVKSSSRVYDKSGVLSEATVGAINDGNIALYESTGSKAEIVAVVEKGNSSDKGLYKKAEKLFKEYKVKDGGVLFIVSVPTYAPSSGRVDFGTAIGGVIDGLMNDIFGGGRQAYAYYRGRNVDYSIDSRIDGIFESAQFRENYAERNYDAAVLYAFNAVSDYLEQSYGAIKNKETSDNYTYASNTAYQSSDNRGAALPATDRTFTSVFGTIFIFVVFFIILNGIIKKNRRRRRRNNAINSIRRGGFF